MKDDLISRQAAIDALCDICPALKMNGECVFGGSQDCEDVKCLMSLPAEPERKQGEWINAVEQSDGGTVFCGYRCSVCGYWKSIGEMNFCPNCGAYMRGEKDD